MLCAEGSEPSTMVEIIADFLIRSGQLEAAENHTVIYSNIYIRTSHQHSVPAYGLTTIVNHPPPNMINVRYWGL